MSEALCVTPRSTRFWDRIADRYARQPIADEASYRRKLEVTREYLRPDMKVLEFGCGTGSTALEHAPYVEHIHAIDVSARMIEIARAKAEASGARNLSFEQSTIEALDAPEASYDAVLALSVLHLLEDKEAAIAKVHRLLTPGGVFVTSTACLRDSPKLRLLIAVIGPPGRWLGLLPLVRVFSRGELQAPLADAGFDIEHAWRPGKDKAAFIVARKRG